MIDKTLVQAMKQADEAAFASCYEQLSAYIYSIVFRICGSEAIAEEIMQESFIHGFNQLAQLKNDAAFTPWLKRIAFNKTMEFLRKSAKEVTLDEHTQNTLVDECFSKQLMAENQLAYLLGHISPQERLVVWMYVVEGYSHHQIADLFEKTLSYSKSIVSRSLAKLREVGEDDGA